MENKYFTPEISDIRFGYEYEKWIPAEKEWRKSTIVDLRLDFIFTAFSGKIQEQWIRVPYLTKEQIEAEGWESCGEIGDYKKDGYKALYGIISNSSKSQHYLSIVQGDNFFVRYAGECKDINTFRYIMKLLNI